MTNEEIKNVIESEGLGYAVECYLGESEIDDKTLAAEWEKAKTALITIRKMLELED